MRKNELHDIDIETQTLNFEEKLIAFQDKNELPQAISALNIMVSKIKNTDIDMEKVDKTKSSLAHNSKVLLELIETASNYVMKMDKDDIERRNFFNKL